MGGKRRGIIYGVVIFVGVLVVSLIAEGERASAIEAFGTVSFLVAALAAVYLYHRWDAYTTLIEPASDLSAATVGDTVEVDGILKAGDETLPAPFTENETLGVLWTVDEKRDIGSSTYWTTIAGGGGTADPVVRLDNGQEAELNIGPVVTTEEKGAVGSTLGAIKLGIGTSSLLGGGIEIDGVSFDIEATETVYKVDAGESPPPHVEDFLTSQDVNPIGEKEWSLGLSNTGARQFKESRLSEGDTVFVRAQVTDTGFDRATLAPAEDSPTIIADTTEEQYITRFQTFIYTAISAAVLHGLVVIGLLGQTVV